MRQEAANERDLSRFEGEGGPSAPSGLSSSQPGTARARDAWENAARLIACVPILRVRNARASTRYFLEVLGFHKDWEDPPEPGRPLLVSVTRDGVTFQLSERPEDGPLGGRANVHVSDARRLYEELEHHGARMVAPLDVQPDGSVEFMIRDMDDNVIRFDQVANPAAAEAPACATGRPPHAEFPRLFRRRRKPS